jgi:uncharacterized membrane protein
VFAIAITLLVLNLRLPQHVAGGDLTQALLDQGSSLFAYALSFAVIGRFWIVHHRFFAEVNGFDGGLLGLNLFYLAWIVLIPFSSQVLGDHGGHTASVVLYALNLAGVALVGALMFGYAKRAELVRTAFAAREATAYWVRSVVTAAVFLVSIPVAFVNPDVAPYVWLALFFLGVGRRRGETDRARAASG